MTGNNIMCDRRRNADRHCVTLLQLGSNYFFSSIRKSHEPIMPDNMCLSYSNCTMGKVFSHWLSSIYAFSLFFSSVCMAHYSFKVEALKQFSVLWYHSLQLLCFDGRKILMPWMQRGKSLWIEHIPILLVWITIFPWSFK